MRGQTGCFPSFPTPVIPSAGRVRKANELKPRDPYLLTTSAGARSPIPDLNPGPKPHSGGLKIAQDEVSALQTHERESWVTVPSLFMSSLFPALSLRGPSPPMNLLVISQTAVIDSALCQVGFGRPKNPTSDERPTQLNLRGLAS
jgi:hypothetical protein